MVISILFTKVQRKAYGGLFCLFKGVTARQALLIFCRLHPWVGVKMIMLDLFIEWPRGHLFRQTSLLCAKFSIMTIS